MGCHHRRWWATRFAGVGTEHVQGRGWADCRSICPWGPCERRIGGWLVRTVGDASPVSSFCSRRLGGLEPVGPMPQWRPSRWFRCSPTTPQCPGHCLRCPRDVSDASEGLCRLPVGLGLVGRSLGCNLGLSLELTRLPGAFQKTAIPGGSSSGVCDCVVAPVEMAPHHAGLPTSPAVVLGKLAKSSGRQIQFCRNSGFTLLSCILLLMG